MEKTKLSLLVIVGCGCFSLVIFGIDIMIPLGVAGGVPYVLVVLLSAWCPDRRFIFLSAILCTLLTYFGFEFSPTGGEFEKILANRLLAILAIWVTAILLFQRKRIEASLGKFNEELEKRVHDRTNELEIANEKLFTEIGDRKELELELKRKEEWYRLLVDTIPHGIQENDKSGLITYGNPAYHKINGYDQGELYGMKIWDLVECEEEKKTLPEFLDYLINRQPTPTPYITKNRTKDGRKIDIQVDWNYKRNEDGEVIGFVSIITDISEKKRAAKALQKEKERAQRYLDIAEVIMVVLDPNGKVEMLNKKGCALLGIKEEEILGKNWFQLAVPSQVREEVRKIFYNILQGNQDDYEYYESLVINKEGEERLIAWHNALFKDDEGRVTRTLSSGIDITDQRKAEQSLRLAHQQLEERVEERTNQLQTVNEQLKAEIGHRIRVERELREKENRYRTLFNQSPDAIVLIDPETTFPLEFNDKAPRLLGYTREEFGKLRIQDYEARETKEEIEVHVERVLKKGEEAFETKLYTKDGEIRDFLINIRVIELKGKKVFHNIFKDITEQKRAERELENKTRQLLTITEALTACLETGNVNEASTILLRSALRQTESEYGFVGVVVDDPALRILAHEGIVWNDRFNHEFVEPTIHRFHQQGYLEFSNFNNLFGWAITSGETVLSNSPGSDSRAGGLPPGHPPLKSFLGVPIRKGSDTVGLIGVANRPEGYTDLDQDKIMGLLQAAGVVFENYRHKERELVLQAEREQANMKLWKNEERLNLALEATSEGVWDWDLTTDEVVFSPRWCESLGFLPEEIEPHVNSWKRLVHPDDLPRVMDAIKAHLDGRNSVYECENRLMTKSGQWRQNLDKGKVVAWDKTGRPLRMVGVDVDITERKKAEEALRENQAWLETLTEAIPQIVWTAYPDGSLEYVNQQALDYFERSYEELIGWNWFEGVHPDDLPRCLEQWSHAREKSIPFEIEYRLKRAKDNSYRWFIGRALPYKDATGQIVKWLGTCTDISDQKQAELVKSEYLNKVLSAQEEERARIARELHDETGQALTFLLVGLRTLTNLKNIEQMKERVEELRAFTLRTLEDVQRLAVGLHPRALDDLGLNAAIEMYCREYERKHGVVVELNSEELGRNRLSFAIETNLYRILQEAFTNIAKHASARIIKVYIGCENSMVRMIVEDDGCGFKIDDPKGDDGGTRRLGLHGIQERTSMLGGNISVNSSPGNGTSILVEIPKNETVVA